MRILSGLLLLSSVWPWAGPAVAQRVRDQESSVNSLFGGHRELAASPWRVRLLPGQGQFVFTMYGCPGELDRLGPALADFPDTVSAVFELPLEQQRTLGERNSWDLVGYIRSLRDSETTAEAVLGRPAGGATP